MSTCMCGNPVDTIGNSCSRCGALQTLGLGSFASAAEIESAYLTLVKVWHPDRFPTDPKLRQAAGEKLKEINAAHDYLNSGSLTEKPRQLVREPEPVSEQEDEPKDTSAAPEPQEENEEVRRVLKRYGRRSSSKLFLKLAVAVGGLAAAALLWFAIDFLLSANSATARPWEDVKAEVSRDVHATGVRLLANATDDKSAPKKEDAPQDAPPPAEKSAPASPSGAKAAANSVTKGPTAANGSKTGVKPYLTSGLTPMEVLSILGNPTSSSGEKMFYQGSEIDFKDGHVAGWKIDAKSGIRVKLWPDQPSVPGIRAFAVGSSKSDVIALQGTPNLFSDNEFGYGGSVVFFKNDLVVGWKEDPGSVRLRVAH